MRKTLLKLSAAVITFAAMPSAMAQDADTTQDAAEAAESAKAIAKGAKKAVEAADAAAEAIEEAIEEAVSPDVKTVDADPALWVVKDDDTTIYMFGTVHFLKPGLTWFDEAVKEAFDKSDTVVLEIKPGNPAKDQEIFAKFAIDQSGKGARSSLNEEEKQSYEKAMTSLGLPVAALDPFKPWAAALVMQITALQKVGFDPRTGVEKILETEAVANDKAILGLETAEYQFGLFDSFSDESQKSFLTQSIDSIDEIDDGLDQLVKLWSDGQPQELGALMQKDLTDPEIRQKLLTTRNANWAKWISARMDKPGTVFMAVGAGHLAGSADVKSLLGAYALTAERIDY